jgi:hypothetical protein
VARGSERGRFLALLKTVYGRMRRESQEVRERKPPLKTGLCYWSIMKRKERQCWGPGLHASQLGPHHEESCFQHFGLRET